MRIQHPWVRQQPQETETKRESALILQPNELDLSDDTINAWIDVPDVMSIIAGRYNVFPFRYRNGLPAAVGAFLMFFFDTAEHARRFLSPLSRDDLPLPRAVFTPPTPVTDTDREPEEWIYGQVQLIASPNLFTEGVRLNFFGAAVIQQFGFANLRLPEELNLL